MFAVLSHPRAEYLVLISVRDWPGGDRAIAEKQKTFPEACRLVP
jgi:hypothetical protein